MGRDISFYFRKVIVKNALKALRELPDESIDCVVTSPPYYLQRLYPPDANDVWDGDPNCEHEWIEYELKEGNRSGYVNPEKANTGKDKKALGKLPITGVFCKKCGAWYGQLGLEPHPELYVKHLADIFDEIYRVLKPTGTVWLNLGDTYWGGGRGLDVKKAAKEGTYDSLPKVKWIYEGWLKPRQLLLIPYRVAIELQERGWIVRDVIIWAKSVWFVKENDTKGNAMPESVKNRFKRSHEVIFLLTKSDKYYFNLDAVRVPHKTQPTLKDFLTAKPTKHDLAVGRVNSNVSYHDPLHTKEYHPKGKNPGNVWQINLEPFPEAHFAVYPKLLVVPCILAGCPPNGVVLDPFMGSGTTAVVVELINRQRWDKLKYPANEYARSIKWNLKWIGIEPVKEYVNIIAKRLREEVGLNVKPEDIICE